MVCVRCKMAVEKVLNDTGVPYLHVVLGKATLAMELTTKQNAAVEQGLKHYELELMEDKTKILVEQIKTEINTLLLAAQPLHLKLSVYLSNALDYSYTYIANTFSEQEGITLERYFITQRIERAKELMVYEGLSLAEIMDILGYSSVSHLCVQFKKVTGFTPAEFRKLCLSKNFEWRPLPL